MHKPSPFSQGLRRAMRLNDYTIKKLATRLNVSMATVQNWRTGLIPNSNNLICLAAELRCSVDSLLSGSVASKEEIEHYKNAPIESVPAHVAKAMGIIKSGVQARLIKERGLTEFMKKQEQEYLERQRSKPWEKLGAKLGVDSITHIGNSGCVKVELKDLMEAVRAKAGEPGKKAELARFLVVTPQMVSAWLSGTREPSGQYTVKLANWVGWLVRK